MRAKGGVGGEGAIMESFTLGCDARQSLKIFDAAEAALRNVAERCALQPKKSKEGEKSHLFLICSQGLRLCSNEVMGS